ncbi:hypothetical protein PSPO01_12755 [Paraphaeosphaeria sporulosa]
MMTKTALSEERHRLQKDLRKKDLELGSLSSALTELRGARDPQRCQSKNIAYLKSKNSHPGGDVQVTWELKRDIAFYFTQLDLAHQNYRIFTCSHNRLANLPDGNKSTRQHDAGFTASDMFRNWQHDKVFIEEYRQHRAYLTKHHSAHQQNDPGRGDHAHQIQETCKYPITNSPIALLITTVIALDGYRGVVVQYK